MIYIRIDILIDILIDIAANRGGHSSPCSASFFCATARASSA